MHFRFRSPALLAAAVLAACLQPVLAQAPPAAAGVNTVPGMPPVVDRHNLYSEIAPGKM
jgi:hypothetical protein